MLALRMEGAHGEDPTVAPRSGEHTWAASLRGDEDLGPATTRTCLLQQPRARKRVSNFRREQSRADTSATVSCDPEQRTGRQSPDAQELSRCGRRWKRLRARRLARGAQRTRPARFPCGHDPRLHPLFSATSQPIGAEQSRGPCPTYAKTCANHYENNGQLIEQWAKVLTRLLAKRGAQRPVARNSHLLSHQECNGDGSGWRRTRSARLAGEADGPRVAATRGAAAGADRRQTLRALREHEQSRARGLGPPGGHSHAPRTRPRPQPGPAATPTATEPRPPHGHTHRHTPQTRPADTPHRHTRWTQSMENLTPFTGLWVSPVVKTSQKRERPQRVATRTDEKTTHLNEGLLERSEDTTTARGTCPARGGRRPAKPRRHEPIDANCRVRSLRPGRPRGVLRLDLDAEPVVRLLCENAPNCALMTLPFLSVPMLSLNNMFT